MSALGEQIEEVFHPQRGEIFFVAEWDKLSTRNIFIITGKLSLLYPAPTEKSAALHVATLTAMHPAH